MQQTDEHRPSTMGLDLIELETFIAVAQAGSFSVAAVQLHVTQSTVTGRIQRLENTLGTKLLRRTTRKVEATPQGAKLLLKANKALCELGSLVFEFRSKARLELQRVVVAATPTLAALTLAPIIHSYSERFPDVEVELLDLQYSGVLEAVGNGTADMGVLALDADEGRFQFEALWSDDMLLVAPRGHPLAKLKRVGLEEFAVHSLMVLGQYEGLRKKIADTLLQGGLSMRPSKVVANLNTLLGMLEADIGVTILPRFMAGRAEVAKHALLEVDGVDLSRQFGLVMAPRKKLNAAGQSFSRHFKQATATMFARPREP